MFFTVNILFEV